MKLFKISQSVNNDYDTYSDAVVAAETEEEAQKTHPAEKRPTFKKHEWWNEDTSFTSWAMRLDQVKVDYIGEAKPGTEPGVICASFHAG
jgi:hypothetical protein